MANTVSSIKRIRQTERKTEYNRQAKSRLRHQIRKMRRALAANDTASAETLLPQTFSLVDRAAKNGIIKKNSASRFKSRLHLRLKKLQGAAA